MLNIRMNPEQIAGYRRDGFVVLPEVFTPGECHAVIEHQMALAEGRLTVEGQEPRDTAAANWGRSFNPHVHDAEALHLLIHPKLQAPLEQVVHDGQPGQADGIQTMYFWHGSTQRRHQDQYYLPSCMSAWCAFVDVNEDNGTIWVQKGSHRGDLVTKDDLRNKYGDADVFSEHYNDMVDALFEQHAEVDGLKESPVVASAGDVVLFHGRLIHRGGPIGKPGMFRHVMANHYIPHDSSDWPYTEWPRYDFAGNKRFTTLGDHVGAEQP